MPALAQTYEEKTQGCLGGKAYQVRPTSESVSDSKARPHGQEYDELPACMDGPSGQERHQHRADGIPKHEDNRHDDAVGIQERLDGISLHDDDTTARCWPCARARCRIPRVVAAADVWIPVRRNSGL